MRGRHEGRSASRSSSVSTSSARSGIAAATARSPSTRRGRGTARRCRRRRAARRARRGKRERVRRPVLGLDDPDRPELGGAGERRSRADALGTSALTTNTGRVRPHDGCGDRLPLSASGIVHASLRARPRPRARLASLTRTVGPARTGCEHAAEHRLRERRCAPPPELSRRRFAGGGAEGDDDARHGGRGHYPGKECALAIHRMRRLRRSSMPSRRCSSSRGRQLPTA